MHARTSLKHAERRSFPLKLSKLKGPLVMMKETRRMILIRPLECQQIRPMVNSQMFDDEEKSQRVID